MPGSVDLSAQQGSINNSVLKDRPSRKSIKDTINQKFNKMKIAIDDRLGHNVFRNNLRP